MRISTNDHGLSVQAPAKLNLSLLVLGKRPDGFHELDTVMVSLRMYDTLEFERCDESQVSLRLHTSSNQKIGIPTDERNLVVQAAELLKQSTGTHSGAQIRLTKRIPSEAGMGGGSSDAAATLVALNQLWNLNLPSPELHRLAAQLGSDVNFFLDSEVAARCTGRGEKIAPMAISHPLHFVLVKPPVGLSTGKVFQSWHQKQADVQNALPQDEVLAAIQSRSLAGMAHGIRNALEQSAIDLCEEVRLTLSLLKQNGLHAVGMSGSGTTCFGICSSKRAAQRLAAKLRSQTESQVWDVTSGT